MRQSHWKEHDRDMAKLMARLAIVFLLLSPACLSLFAQEISNPTSAEESPNLLPVIPQVGESQLPLPPGAAAGIVGRIPGEPTPNPDEDKNLYGYSGPYYNTAKLNGKVEVLGQSLYLQPASSWKVSGLCRNQTRATVHIARITAHIRGRRGELLGIATTTPPITELRPGEPGPFMIEAPLTASAVKSIDWHVEYAPAQATSRMFEFKVYSVRASAEYGYYLFGQIRNASSTTKPARIVAAWLDREGYGRVLYVDSPQIAVMVDRPESMEFQDQAVLEAGSFENFVYRNMDPEIVPLLGDARLALWGISK